MIRYRIFLVIFLIPFFSFSQKIERDSIRLFYLGGQSNMDGFGQNKKLPKNLKSTFKNVWIFHGNPVGDEEKNGGIGVWEQLEPGHGNGFFTDGIENYKSDKFGCELSFAKEIQKFYPNEKIAIIKYSKSGTSIDSLAATQHGSWDTDYKGVRGINQYDHFLNTVKNAFKNSDIDQNGIKDYLIPSGILWMQGESDAAHTEQIAIEYYDNLKKLMDLICAALHKDNIPIVIGKISDSWNNKDGKVYKYGELVQYGQEKYARENSNVEIVRSTRYYKYSDVWHYNTQGYIDLGKEFAKSIHMLNKSNSISSIKE